MGRVFANGPEDLDSIPCRVIPKTFKMVLDTSLLNIQQYNVRIKGKVEHSMEMSSTPYTFWSPSTTVADFNSNIKHFVYQPNIINKQKLTINFILNQRKYNLYKTWWIKNTIQKTHKFPTPLIYFKMNYLSGVAKKTSVHFNVNIQYIYIYIERESCYFLSHTIDATFIE